MADYNVPGVVPAPPPPPPAIPPPPPAPPLSPSQTATVARVQERPVAIPEVTEVSVQVRRVVFIDGGEFPKGTREVQIGMRAIPDADQPASASLDRLNAAIQAKLAEFLGGMS